MFKTVIIGCSGHTGYVLSSLSLKKLEISAVSFMPGENSAGLLRSLESKGFSPKIYADYREMLAAEKPALAVVNPPFYLAADVSRTALLAGANVFTDKPAATEFAALEELERTFAAADGLYIGGMFGMRHEAPFLTLRRLYGEGKIGRALLINAQKSYRMGERPAFYRRRETYGGLIPWIAIHGIDLALTLTGEKVESVSAVQTRAANRGHGDMETGSLAMYTLSGGTMLSVSADMLRPASAPTHGDDRLRVVGEDGVLEFIGQTLTLNGGEPLPLDPPGNIFTHFLGQIESGAPRYAEAQMLFESTRAALRTRDAADQIEEKGVTVAF